MAFEKKLNIIIFGASGAIGDFLLKKYFKKNHNLLLFLKDRKKINVLKKRYKSKKSQFIFFEKLDLKNQNEIKKKIIKHKNFLKKTNLIINTIGDQGEINNFFNLSLKKFKETFEINFFSQVILLRNIFRMIKKNKDTLIILFSGGGATSLRENFSSYSLSKIAFVKLVEILSIEFKNKNLRINAISPGIISSKMTRSNLTKSNKLVNLKEKKKIKFEMSKSENSLNKLFNLITMLISERGKKISGKIISSRWDNFSKWKMKDIKKIIRNDTFTLRRVEN